MSTMNVSLPDKMREWIDQQVSTGRYANASDLVRDLIRNAQSLQGAIVVVPRMPTDLPTT